MVSSFPKMQKSSASFSQSIRNRLRLKNLQAQAKNFCRVLDIRVPQIMETSLRQAELGHHALEAIIHGAVRKVAAGLIGKDQVVVHPLLPRIHHHQCLSLLLLSKQLNNRRCKNDDTDLAVLGGGEVIFSTLATISYQLAANDKSAAFEVDAVPG